MGIIQKSQLWFDSYSFQTAPIWHGAWDRMQNDIEKYRREIIQHTGREIIVDDNVFLGKIVWKDELWKSYIITVPMRSSKLMKKKSFLDAIMMVYFSVRNLTL